MTYFVFCIHNHQPVGNFDHVLEEAYQNSYWPFLKAISKYPSIKLTLHTSGFLLDWIMEKRPEYIELLKSMVEAKQVEIMGGGYYEPILQVLPEEDRLAQIRMMSDKIEELFNTRPRGIWLAERVWEPSLPTTLKNAGLEYLLVDDYHFIKSGLKKEELGGYYVTEDQGNVIKIFPGSETLRYLIPFRTVDALEGHLKGLKAGLKKGNAAIYGDDGEKFGVWPGTHRWVFDEGWLESFFKKIEESLGWLKPATLSEYLDAEEPLGRVYLPTTSYMEMGEWSLPPDVSREYTELIEEVKHWKDGERIRRFLQGGTWRNFFSKYPEANWLHKRMLLVSKALKKRVEGRIWDEKLSRAERHLYQAQCNDAYWHGVFGGLYLPHLRTTVYKNLIEAENAAESDMGFRREPVIEKADIDADGYDEVIIRTKELNLFLSPHNGGSLVELDFKPRAVNLTNTLSRWFEGYHHKLEAKAKDERTGEAKSIHDIVKVKEEGLEKYLNYDKSRRVSFVDHFFDDKTGLESFYAGTHAELGDFHNGKYDAAIKDKGLTLSRNGTAAGKRVHLRKDVAISGHNSFQVDYHIKDLDKAITPSDNVKRFAVEFNLLMPCCDGPACLYKFSPMVSDESGIGLGSRGEISALNKVSLIDTFTGVALEIEGDKPAALWRFPIYTVSLSEGGFEKIYQGSCLVFLFPASFDILGVMNLSFRVTAEELL